MELDTGILLILSEVPAEVEERFNEWYDEDHAPGRLGVPRIRTGRRYKQVGIPGGEVDAAPAPVDGALSTDSSRLVAYLMVYELDSLDVLNGDAYQALSSGAPSDLEIEVTNHAKFDRRVYRSMSMTGDASGDDSKVGGDYILCAWESPDRQGSSLEELTAQIAGSPGWLCSRAYALDLGNGPGQLTIDDIGSLEAVAEIAQRRQHGHSFTAGSDAAAAVDIRLFRLHRCYDSADAVPTSTSALGLRAAADMSNQAEGAFAAGLDDLPSADAAGAPDPLLTGVVDIHIHTGPDIFPRKVTAPEAALAAKAAGMAAIVFKSHSTDTAARAELVTTATGFSTFGGVVLNYPVGGLNPHAVTETIRQGGRCVWMPTLSAKNFVIHSDMAPMLKAAIPPDVEGLEVVASRALLPEVEEILDLIAEHQILLAGGHLAAPELVMLFTGAAARGIERMVCNHGDAPFMDVRVEQLQEMASLGAFIEITKVGPIEQRAEMIRKIGVERCVLSTDGGPTVDPSPVDIFHDTLAGLRDLGFSERELRYLSVDVPRFLLQLSDERPRLDSTND